MNIVTTDEKIARFVVLSIMDALETMAGIKLSEQDLILVKNSVKEDLTSLDKIAALFEDITAGIINEN